MEKKRPQWKKFIKEKNPEAFITVNESTEVLGEGFKTLNN